MPKILEIVLQKAENIFPALKEGTSCTVHPASCSCTSVTPPDDAPEVISVKVEEDSGVAVKLELPEPITFPTKAEPDENCICLINEEHDSSSEGCVTTLDHGNEEGNTQTEEQNPEAVTVPPIEPEPEMTRDQTLQKQELQQKIQERLQKKEELSLEAKDLQEKFLQKRMIIVQLDLELHLLRLDLQSLHQSLQKQQQSDVEEENEVEAEKEEEAH